MVSGWVRGEVMVLELESKCPTVYSGDVAFQLGIVPVSSIRATSSVLPSAREPVQRLLEGIQLYVDPIPVVRDSKGGFLAIGNHELLAAAKEYQSDLARPGKVRSSDYCLVALAPSTILDSIQSNPLSYTTSKASDEVARELLAVQYSNSPRTDDPWSIEVHVNSQIFSRSVQDDPFWKSKLEAALGIRTLDLSSSSSPKSEMNSGTEIVLVTPKATQDVLEMGLEYPYGALSSTICPPSGAMMWSLRDFRAE